MNDKNIYEKEVRSKYCKRLCQYREERGLTYAQLGEVLGISPEKYEKIETGKERLKISQLDKLCDFYGASADDLLDMHLPSGK